VFGRWDELMSQLGAADNFLAATPSIAMRGMTQDR
jgi:hypothetical protein